MQKPDTKALCKQAQKSRQLILRMLEKAGSGHPGGSLSAIDLITALFLREMRFRPQEPQWPDRDRFILSKGHGVPALYATLAYCGYFQTEDTLSLRQLGSPFQGHPDRVRLPAVEASTGSLGQGLSVAIGMALSARLDQKTHRIYCLVGDGEMQEGQIWEAIMSAGNFALNNLCLIVDCNKYQIDGAVADIMNLHPLAEKFKAFKWNTLQINGHDMPAILTAFDEARGYQAGPTAIIADTIKGKGVSFMEGDNHWHGVAPSADQLQIALKELNATSLETKAREEE